MKWQHSNRSKEDYNNALARVQKAFDKQARLLTTNLLHPSLHAKKYSESEDLWQARITIGWRFFFKIEADTYIIVRIIPHPKVAKVLLPPPGNGVTPSQLRRQWLRRRRSRACRERRMCGRASTVGRIPKRRPWRAP